MRDPLDNLLEQRLGASPPAVQPQIVEDDNDGEPDALDQLLNARQQQAQPQQAQPQQAQPQQQQPQPQISPDEYFKDASGLERAAAFGDAALSTATNVVADTGELLMKAAQGNPVGRGLVKLLNGNNPFTDDLDPEEEAAIPKQVSNFLRMDPFTPEGAKVKEMVGAEIAGVLEATGADELIEYVSALAKDSEDYVVEEWGVDRPAAQALTAFPQLIFEVAPFTKGAKTANKVNRKFSGNSNSYVDNFLETPDLLQQEIKARDELYRSLKDRGANLRGGTITKAIREVEKQLTLDGIDLKETGIASKLAGQKARLSGKLKVDVERTDRGKFRGANVPENLRGARFNERKVIEQARAPKVETFQDFENLKKSLFAGIDPTNKEKMYAASRAARTLDIFLDRKMQEYVMPDIDGSIRDVRKTVRKAREISGRVRRASDLNDLLYNASLADSAAGQMSYLRDGIRNTLRDKNQRKFYRPAEIELMEKIAQNKIPDDVGLLRMLGGTIGKVAPPVARFVRSYYGGKFREMPTVSRAKYLANSLRENTERTGEAFVALQRKVIASDNANEAAVRYLKEVPKNKRDPAELGAILADSGFDLNVPIERMSKLKKEAFQIARGKQMVDGVLRSSLIGNEPQEEDENE